jgi:hypothetical protein
MHPDALREHIADVFWVGGFGWIELVCTKCPNLKAR